jgi:hypothetical protein
VLVASELGTNAVIHARGPLRLVVELRGRQLHLAVQDPSPYLLHLGHRPRRLAEGGGGLPLLQAHAGSWQAQRPSEGGKVVACVLDLTAHRFTMGGPALAPPAAISPPGAADGHAGR